MVSSDASEQTELMARFSGNQVSQFQYYRIKMIRPKTVHGFASYSAVMRTVDGIKIAGPANAILSCADPPIHAFTLAFIKE